MGFEILKLSFTVVLPLLLTSTAAKLFGQVIGLLFFYLVAVVVLVIAAWIATTPAKIPAESADVTDDAATDLIHRQQNDSGATMTRGAADGTASGTRPRAERQGLLQPRAAE